MDKWPNMFDEMGDHSMGKWDDHYQPLLSLGTTLLDDGNLPGQVPRSEKPRSDRSFSSPRSDDAVTVINRASGSTTVGQQRTEVPGLFALFSAPTSTARPRVSFPVASFPNTASTNGLTSTRLRRTPVGTEDPRIISSTAMTLLPARVHLPPVDLLTSITTPSVNVALQLETQAREIRDLEQVREAMQRDKDVVCLQLTNLQQRYNVNANLLTEARQREEKLQQQVREWTECDKQSKWQLQEEKQSHRQTLQREKDLKQQLVGSGEREKQCGAQLRESTETLQEVLRNMQSTNVDKKAAEQKHKQQVQQLEDQHKLAVTKLEQGHNATLKAMQLKYQDLVNIHEANINECRRIQQSLQQSELRFARQEALCVSEQTRLSQEAKDWKERKRESDARCQEMEKRVSRHIDERLSSATRDQFNPLKDFPPIENVARHYRTVMNELRKEAVVFIEDVMLPKAPYEEILVCLEFTIRACYGWVLHHKMPQYEEWLRMVFAPSMDGEDGLKANASVRFSDTDKVEKKDDREEAQPGSVKRIIGGVCLAAVQDTETSRVGVVGHTISNCLQKYSSGERLTMPPISPLRQWLHVLLRTLHKWHNSPKQMVMDAKQIWQAVCELQRISIPWGKPIESYITDLLSVCWEIALSTPKLDLMCTQYNHNTAHYDAMDKQRDKRDVSKLGFPILVTENGVVMVKGEVFFKP